MRAALESVCFLDAGDIGRVCELAMERNSAKDSAIRSYSHAGFEDAVVAHRIGLAAELAYEKLTGVRLNSEIYERGDANHDFGRVEVKASSWPKPDIELKVTKKEYATRAPAGYVLARVEPGLQKVEFVGSISRGRFDRLKTSKQHRETGPVNWCVEGRLLRKGFIVDYGGAVWFVPFVGVGNGGAIVLPMSNNKQEGN